MKLNPHTIKEDPKANKKGHGFLDFSVNTPQQYINHLYQEYENIQQRIKYNLHNGDNLFKLQNRLVWLKHEISNMKVELDDDYIYTPDKKIKVESIKDIIYYEALYGKKIYDEDFCNEKPI